MEDSLFINIFTLILALAIDWIVACGIWFLVCKCFAINFVWLQGTGVWLFSKIFPKGSTVKSVEAALRK